MDILSPELQELLRRSDVRSQIDKLVERKVSGDSVTVPSEQPGEADSRGKAPRSKDVIIRLVGWSR